MLPTCFRRSAATLALVPLLAASAMAQSTSGTTTPSANASTQAPPGTATARCKSLTGEFQAACEVRIMGAGAAGSTAGVPAVVKIETEPQAQDQQQSQPPPRAGEAESPRDASMPTIVVPLPKP